MPSERPAGHLDLLSGGAGEPSPEGREDRIDGLAGSRHSRIELPPPPGEPLPSGKEAPPAEELLAAVCQSFLRDLSPAFLLLDDALRDRSRALGAFTFTLFDFARQRGTEGERLAQINQWEFSLEAALSGQETGQPIFDRMAELHRSAPWPMTALDALIAEARRRISAPRPLTAADAVARSERLGGALLHALTGSPPSDRLTRLAAIPLRAAVVRDLAEETRQHRSPLPVDEFEDGWGEVTSERADAAAKRELAALAAAGAEEGAALADLASPELRRALRFAIGATSRWSREAERLDLRKEAPTLGLGARLVLLLGARLARQPR